MQAQGAQIVGVAIRDKPEDVAGFLGRYGNPYARLLNARHRVDRVVYAGRRDSSPIAFVQEGDQLIGPIFNLTVKGNF